VLSEHKKALIVPIYNHSDKLTMCDMFVSEQLRKAVHDEFLNRKGNETWKAQLPDGPPLIH